MRRSGRRGAELIGHTDCTVSEHPSGGDRVDHRCELLPVRDPFFTATMWDLEQTVSAALGGDVPGISVTVPTLTDPSLAPPGQHIVIIMAVAPTARKAVDADLSEGVMQLAEHVLPGLRAHLTMNLGAPGSHQVPVRRIESIYGAAITPRQVGFWRLPHRTPIKGLLLVGQWTRPGHGVPWVMESGVQVARAILGRSAAAEKMPHGLIPVHA